MAGVALRSRSGPDHSGPDGAGFNLASETGATGELGGGQGSPTGP